MKRPLEGDWPFVWLHATYVKVRQDGRIVSVAAIPAIGVTTDGRREVVSAAAICTPGSSMAACISTPSRAGRPSGSSTPGGAITGVLNPGDGGTLVLEPEDGLLIGGYLTRFRPATR